jgi:hypothetical protein
VSTAGGGSGGTVAFTTAFSSQNVGATAISTAQMPSHSHSVNDPSHNHSAGDYGHDHSYAVITANSGTSYSGGSQALEGATTGVGYANVYVNGNYTGVSVNANGSGATHTHTLDLAVQYIDMIIASKN